MGKTPRKNDALKFEITYLDNREEMMINDLEEVDIFYDKLGSLTANSRNPHFYLYNFQHVTIKTLNYNYLQKLSDFNNFRKFQQEGLVDFLLVRASYIGIEHLYEWGPIFLFSCICFLCLQLRNHYFYFELYPINLSIFLMGIVGFL